MSPKQLGQAEYVVFDMDGLLSWIPGVGVCGWADIALRWDDGHSDSERIYTVVTNQILGRYGCTMTWDVKAGIMGKTQLLAAEYILSNYPAVTLSAQELMDEGNRLREDLFRRVEPMRGATALVQGLHKAGVPIALATGSSDENLVRKTSHLPHIFSLFPSDSILTADSPKVRPGRGKPFPDIFLAAAASLGRDVGTAESCTPAQAAERKKGMVFEDARPGVQAGVAAGMNVIWVPDPELLALNPGESYGAAETLEDLEQWDPSRWGLPELPGFPERRESSS